MEHRIRALNRNPLSSGSCVVYWMQQAQRAHWNHALELAIRESSVKRLPVYVFFCLTADFPAANLRHYTFMLQGLKETAWELKRRGIGFIVRTGTPGREAAAFSRELNACMLVTDCGHTKVQKKWRKSTAEKLEIPVLEVETDMVVPVWVASDGAEAAAWTLRKKLNPLMEHFLEPVLETEPVLDSTSLPVETVELGNIDGILGNLNLDTSVKPSPVITGGTSVAVKRWNLFREKALFEYGKNARQPGVSGTSLLSPYLHFGQISPLKIALEAKAAGNAEEFLEQLIVRRELAINFTWYHRGYADYSSIPEWADKTLGKHMKDHREAIYTLEQLERAETHDEYWNAAQRELTITGHMHGYMRMYWGKKVIQWTSHPKTAHRYLVHLNDKYQLDGRDPSGYAGIAWCFGRHDRPFGTFPVTGNIRRLGSSLDRMRRAKSSRYNGYLKRISSGY